jgi:signal transduction histidine kinase
MKKLKAIFKELNRRLNSGFFEPEYSIEVIAKVRMLNIVCLIGIVNLTGLGIVAFIQNNAALGIFDFLIALFLIFLIYYLQKSKNIKLAGSIGVIPVGMLYIFLFSTGGVNNTAHLWLYTFPLFAYFLMDTRRGTLFTIILFVMILIIYVLQDQFTFITNYSTDFILRFIPSFLVVFFYAYIFERTREKTFKIINSKNEELNTTINKLEVNENKLKKLHNELEERVEQRTAELNETNKQLLKEIAEKNKANEEAERSNRLKTEFLAQMSHEIRTPVNTVLSFSSLIKEDLLLNNDEKYKEEFQAIEKGSDRLIRTIDSLLNMSQLQSGSFEIKKEEVDLIEDVLKNLLREFKPRAEQKRLDINIINQSKNKYVLGDKYTLSQLFANLIDNALKYTETGRIDLKLYDDGNEILYVDVADTGVGISKEFIKTIFTPFRQEEQGYTRRYEGNGLGLALVKKYCELNNADITVQSTKNKGTVFTVSFNQF